MPQGREVSATVDVADQVIAALAGEPSISSVRLGGSRAAGTATEFSDWDFLLQANDFAAAREALPDLVAPLRPLAQLWDRLGEPWCYMLIVPGPTKIDLIFPDEPHVDEPPWQPHASNLAEIDTHFWDWMLWLSGKAANRKTELVDEELPKLFDHLLEPLGVKSRPGSLAEGIRSYVTARDEAEHRFGVSIPRHLEDAVAPTVLRRLSLFG